MAGDKSITTFVVKRSAPLHPQFFLNVGKNWMPSAVRFGAFAGCLFLYFTDWQIFMNKIPFYRTKFEKKEPIV